MIVLISSLENNDFLLARNCTEALSYTVEKCNSYNFEKCNCVTLLRSSCSLVLSMGKLNKFALRPPPAGRPKTCLPLLPSPLVSAHLTPSPSPFAPPLVRTGTVRHCQVPGRARAGRRRATLFNRWPALPALPPLLPLLSPAPSLTLHQTQCALQINCQPLPPNSLRICVVSKERLRD